MTINRVMRERLHFSLSSELKIFYFLIILLLGNAGLWGVDYDCVMIGSSPCSLFEALYQARTGAKVLVLDEAEVCGGAWRTIDILGMKNVDGGCHQIGSNLKIKNFLETYTGCKMVSMDFPHLPFEQNKGSNGYYFSQGCFELMDHLMKLLAISGIELRLSTRAEEVLVNEHVMIKTNRGSLTAKKLFVTPMSALSFPQAKFQHNLGSSTHHHIYLLVQDPSPCRFTYRTRCGTGIIRAVNLTPFSNMESTGRQLIVLQVSDVSIPLHTFLESLKTNKLLDPSAYLLQSDTYSYRGKKLHRGSISQIHGEEKIEVLQTNHFQSMTNYIPRWEKVLKPYQELCMNELR